MTKEKNTKVDYHKCFRSGIIGATSMSVRNSHMLRLFEEFLIQKFDKEFVHFMNLHKEDLSKLKLLEDGGITYINAFKEIVDELLVSQLKEKDDEQRKEG